MTAPTAGMAVQFQPTQFPADPAPPLLGATITAVHSLTSVDLEITAGNGVKYVQVDTPLLQIGDPAPGPVDGHVPFFARMLT